MDSAFYILLVGINQYKSSKIRNLNGCVNDVKAIATLLETKFNVPSDNIEILTDEKATQQAIKSAFQQHLIARAQDWHNNQSTTQKPTFLFHFSGHGSYITHTDHARPSGITEESIVPYDSRTDDIFDIKDWELAEFINQLAQYDIDNTIISLDCCHSGSGTRDVTLDDIDDTVRLCPPDTRPQPTQNPIEMTRGGCTHNAWKTLQNTYVLLAACRYDEKARENIDFGYGLMTYFLVHELNQYDTDLPISYQDLQHRIKRQFEQYYLSHNILEGSQQSVQCEGNVHCQVFSGLTVQPAIFFPVLKQEGDKVWIDAGFINGLSENSLLSIYPEQQKYDDSSQALATLKVDTLETTKCSCIFVSEVIELPKYAKAATQSLSFGLQRTVFIQDDATQLQHCLQEVELEDHFSITHTEKQADFSLSNTQINISDKLAALNQAQSIPFEFNSASDCSQLQHTLKHVSRFYNVLELHNPQRKQQISIEVKLFDFDTETGEPMSKPIEKNDQLVVPNKQAIVIEITNHAEKPLYFALFDLSYDWSISQVYPAKGEHKRISVAHTIHLGLSKHHSEQLEFQLPPDLSKLHQTFKVVATEDEACFDALELPEIGLPYQPSATRGGALSPFDLLLQQAMLTEDVQRSLLQSRANHVDNRWTTAELAFWIAR